MQKSYLIKLCELAERDPRVTLLLADSGTSYDELFNQSFPNRMLDFGIAEENMVAASAGMAKCGKIPFVYTAGAFLAYRSLEFIRDDVCMQNLNVKLVGMGTGLAWSTLGPTHHTTEDLGILRSIPNLVILNPSSPVQTAECIEIAYQYDGPVYVRIGMGGEHEYYSENINVQIGNNLIAKAGNDIAIISSGTILEESLAASEILDESGISTSVIDAFSIYPFDIQSIIECCSQYKAIISVEEHSIIGGLGSAIADIIAENKLTVNFLKIGLVRTFANGYGTQQEVRQQNGLDANTIANKIEKWLETI